jgi:hypothetical protein
MAKIPIMHLRFNRFDTHCSRPIRRKGRLELETAVRPSEVPATHRVCRVCEEARKDRIAMGSWSWYEVPA